MQLSCTGRAGLEAGNRSSFWRNLISTAFFLVLAVALADPAAARAKFSAISVDARSGKILYADDPDGLRHPASLTKVMTLYLLFQDLKSGRLKISSPLRASARASRMPPTKLNLRPGQTITVDQAIRALVTQSANDVASTIAENLGGSEASFAVRMTKTARALGMSRTTFKNASGLPDNNQWTTARDMATLSLRIQRDFPAYYPYFRIMTFTWNGRTIKTHNKLLGRFAGTDGIKTGYIRASGFNLTSSVKRGDKRIVGVVMGATSSNSRNRYMMAMLDRTLPMCKNGNGIVASVNGAKVVASSDVDADSDGSADQQKQSNFATRKIAAARTADVTPPSVDAGTAETGNDEDKAEGDADSSQDQPLAQPAVASTTGPAKLPFKVKSSEDAAAPAGQIVSSPQLASWNIQIGAYPNKRDAQQRLLVARQSGVEVLQGKQAFTMAVEMGDNLVYRARFSGFSEATARLACKQLTTRGFGCIPFAPQS